MTKIRIVLICLLSAVAFLLPAGAQEKKKGLFQRLNEKLEQANPQGGAQPGAPAAQKPQSQPRAAQAGQLPGSYRLTRRETCTTFDWKAPTTQDPALALSNDYQRQYEGDYPDPNLEPARKVTLDELGKTDFLKVTFAPRRYRTLYRLNGKNTIIEPRDPVAPFEVFFRLENGKLRVGVCDEKAVFHEAIQLSILPEAPYTVSFMTTFDMQLVDMGRQVHTAPCPRCYFVNKTFHSGTDEQRYIILVNPDLTETPHYVIKVPPYEENFQFRPTGNLCQVRRSGRSCDPGTLENLEVTQERADDVLFPGVMTNRWYVRCAAERCEDRTLGDVVNGSDGQGRPN